MSLLSRTSLRSDIKWGLGWGFWLAGGFSLLGTALFVLQGMSERPSRFSFPLVILGYFAMGVIGGLLVGLFRPLTQRRIGATMLGMIIGIVVYSIAGLVAVGEKEFLSLPGLVSALVLGTVIGGLSGHTTWNRRASRR
ncbi:MAG: hypothetical protein M3037_08360 [Gemmatimonadota bacterium]|nr:hypothetical protein [Gemmatimonadota bacterium]